MATSTKRTPRRLTPEEEKQREEQKEIVRAAFALSHMRLIKSLTQNEHQNQLSIIQANHHQNQPVKKRKTVEEDNSEETLKLLLKWISNTSDISPEKIIGDSVGRCSKPIRKQLMESDVKEDQNRLMLGKLQVEKLMFPLLKESEIPRGKEGIRVSVYGPDGEANEMMFKMWSSEKTPVLTCGWNKFVKKYELKMHCDFLMIWIFRHRETREICFAIKSTRLPIYMKLSRRISKIVFKMGDSRVFFCDRKGIFHLKID